MQTPETNTAALRRWFSAGEAIGQGWQGTTRALACVIGIAVVAIDLLWLRTSAFSPQRLMLGAGAVSLLALLPKGGPAAVGLRVQADPAWRIWPVWTLLLGAAVAGLTFAYLGVAKAMGGGDPNLAPMHLPDGVWGYIRSACVWAPFEEELIYRVALLAPLAGLLPRTALVLLSGGVFYFLHTLYGNSFPNHFFAGLVMGWAYLRSGNLLVPVGLHAAGNLAVYLQNAWLGNLV